MAVLACKDLGLNGRVLAVNMVIWAPKPVRVLGPFGPQMLDQTTTLVPQSWCTGYTRKGVKMDLP